MPKTPEYNRTGVHMTPNYTKEAGKIDFSCALNLISYAINSSSSIYLQVTDFLSYAQRPASLMCHFDSWHLYWPLNHTVFIIQQPDAHGLFDNKFALDKIRLADCNLMVIANGGPICTVCQQLECSWIDLH